MIDVGADASVARCLARFVYTGRLEAPFSVDMLYSTAKLLKLQILTRVLEAQMNSAEASASAGMANRRGRPPVGFHRPREVAASPGYHQTNSQLAANRRSVTRRTPGALSNILTRIPVHRYEVCRRLLITTTYNYLFATYLPTRYCT